MTKSAAALAIPEDNFAPHLSLVAETYKYFPGKIQQQDDHYPAHTKTPEYRRMLIQQQQM